MSERNVVRTAALAVAAASVVLPLFMAVPGALPATAMGSVLLLYLERLAAVFAILLLLLVFLYRSLVHGQLPRAVSGRGAEWADIAATSSSSAARLQAQIDGLEASLARIRNAVEADE